MVQKCQIGPFSGPKTKVGNERVEEEKIQEENVVDGEFGLWRGKKAKNGSNPGKLIVGMKEKFLFSRKIGNHLHFHCAKKETLNCEIKARLLDDHGKLTLTELGWNHNHEDMEGQIVAKKIQREMKEEFERVFCKSVREVIQVIMSK